MNLIPRAWWQGGAGGCLAVPWYALYCRSCREHLVAQRLEEDGVEHYFPHLVRESPRRHSREKRGREIITRILPGYVFAKLNLNRWVPGGRYPEIVRIIGRGADPEVIPDYEIDAVRLMVTAPAQGVVPCAYVAVGDLCTVERGPFRGLEGYVVYMPNNKARVVVSISAIGGSLSTAEMDLDCLSIKQRLAKAA